MCWQIDYARNEKNMQKLCYFSYILPNEMTGITSWSMMSHGFSWAHRYITCGFPREMIWSQNRDPTSRTENHLKHAVTLTSWWSRLFFSHRVWQFIEDHVCMKWSVIDVLPNNNSFLVIIYWFSEISGGRELFGPSILMNDLISFASQWRCDNCRISDQSQSQHQADDS
jgi:hypothetical protein